MSIAKELQSGIITLSEYVEAGKRFNQSERLCDECKNYIWNKDGGYYSSCKWNCCFEPEE